MNWKSFKPIPILIASVTIGLACFFQSPFLIRQFDFFQHSELKTYDKRVRFSNRFLHPIATNLALVQIDEVTAKNLAEPPFNVGFPYPRQIYGRLVRELSAQGAKAIAFDVMFPDLRPYDSPVLLTNNTTIDSDEFFARQMQVAGNVILAAEAEPIDKNLSEDEKAAQNDQRAFPPPLFETNALAIGDIRAEFDSDGVLRKARAFVDDAEHGRRWHMGIILAARELGLDLKRAVIEPTRIILKSTNGVERIIPTDGKGFFHINWSVPIKDARLTTMAFALPVYLDYARQSTNRGDYLEVLETFRSLSGKTNLVGENPMSGKLVVVGSRLIGNNVTDIGPTPLDKQDYLVSKHWNVANAVITNQFIQRSPYLLDFAIIIFTGLLSALLTLKLRALSASLAVIVLITLHIAAAFFLFVQFRYWIPIVIPVVGALLMTHVCMVTYRVRVEQKERRRVKSVFSKIVSPNVVTELLNSEKLSLSGERRKITVLFADVRGFTEMTDLHQARAEEFVCEHQLTGEAAEAHFDEQARQTLETVNTYLGIIADKVKEHNGTLDKYIGDCVMAFWGAPTPNEQHARDCVLAAIGSQRAMFELNEQRAVENQKREQENPARIAAGENPLSILPLLSLGTGINSGTVIVGLMGSTAHILNYTVFGREVNLASRLEGVSGRGRIIIGASTFRDLQRDDPPLAATCRELDPVTVKGIKNAVTIYEVPWKIEKPLAAPKQSAN